MAVITVTVKDKNGLTATKTATADVTALGAWPDATNTGHLRAPGYPGSLTALSSVSSNNTYNFRDLNGLSLNGASNITFNGCRFKSNSVDFANVRLVNCHNIRFNYCSIVPLSAQLTHPGVWPSAGAGTTADGDSGYAPYMIGGNQGYQYGIRMEGGTSDIFIDHCDIWGFGNAVDFSNGNRVTITDTWIHDAANPDAQRYHTDGPGYLEGGPGRNNITIDHCTIASLGNTNGIAFQAATSAYSFITVNNCYLSGFGYCVDMCHNASGNNNLTFTNNILGTDVRWHYGPIYADFTSQFSQASNVWRNNKLKVRPGTSPASSSNPKWVAADDGKFVMPSGALRTTDFE